MFIARHGDLLIKEIKEVPKNTIKQKDNILMSGEFTGHHHVLELEKECGDIYIDDEGIKYFEVTKITPLTHSEHKTIEIPIGKYSLTIEREFDPFKEKIRQVRD